MTLILSCCNHVLKNLNTQLPVFFLPSLINSKVYTLSHESLKILGLSFETINKYAGNLINPLMQRQVETISSLVNALRTEIEEAAHPTFKKAIDDENLPLIKQMAEKLECGGFDSLKLFEKAALTATDPEKIKNAKTTAYKTTLLIRLNQCVKEDNLDSAVDTLKTLAPQFTNYPLTSLTEYREQHAKNYKLPFCNSVKEELLTSYLSKRIQQAVSDNKPEDFLNSIQLATKLHLPVQSVVLCSVSFTFHVIQSNFIKLTNSDQFSFVKEHLFKNSNTPDGTTHCLQDSIDFVTKEISSAEATNRFNHMWCEFTCLWERDLKLISPDLQKKVINSVLELSRIQGKWTGLLSLYMMNSSLDFETLRQIYLKKIQTSLKEGTFDDAFFQTLIEIRGVFNAYRLLHEAHAANGSQGGPLTETLFEFFSKGSELSWEMTYSYAYGLAQLEKDATPRYLNKNEQRPLSIFIANKNSFAVPPPQIRNEGRFKRQRWAVYLCKEEIPETEKSTRAFQATITKVALYNFKTGKNFSQEELEVLKAIQPYPNFVKLIASAIHTKERSPWEMHEKPVILCSLFEEGDLKADTEPKDMDLPHPRRPLTIGLLIKYTGGIADGMAVMHDQLSLFHRDLKAANIFVEGDKIGIGDFGKTRKASEMPNAYYGTPRYSAPEVFQNKTHQSKPTDMYALGHIIKELMDKNTTLFWENELEIIYHSQTPEPQMITQMTDKMKSFASEFQNWPGTTVIDQLKRIVGQLLEVDPTKRMTASQLSAAIKKISLNLPPDMAVKEI